MARPPLVPPGPELTAAERTRYARHLLLPGPRRRRASAGCAARVLVVGAGGLGSPPCSTSPPRASAPSASSTTTSSTRRTSSARWCTASPTSAGRRPSRRPRRCAPSARRPRWSRTPPGSTTTTALDVVADYDLVVDGADNFPTRYLVGDACARLGVPHVWGSVYRFDGQVSVWWAGEGPCYACVFPHQPPPDAVPSCAVGGVLGRGVREHRVGHGHRGGQARHRHRRAARRPPPRARRPAPDLGHPAGHRRPRMPGVRLRRRPHPPARGGRRRSDCVRAAGGDDGARASAPARPSTSSALRELLERARSTAGRPCSSTCARPGEREVVTIPGECGCRWRVRRPRAGRRGVAGWAGIPAGEVYVYCKTGSARARRSTSCAAAGSTRSTSRAASSPGCARSTPRPADARTRPAPGARTSWWPTRHVHASGCRWPVVES